MNKCVVVLMALAAACALAAPADLFQCEEPACPAGSRMHEMFGEGLVQGDNRIDLGGAKLVLKGVDLASGKILGGFAVEGGTLAIHRIVLFSGCEEWAANVYSFPDGKRIDSDVMQTPGSSPICRILICYTVRLIVEKTADACYTEKFTWAVAVSTPVVGVVELQLNQPYNAPFQYDMSRTSVKEQYKISGKIIIKNPDPLEAAHLEGVIDMYNGVALPVVCPVTFPYHLPAGCQLECTYSYSLPPFYGVPPCKNEAIAKVCAESKVLGASGEVAVDFKLCDQIDECVNENKKPSGELMNENCDSGFVPSRSVTVPFISAVCGTFHIPFDVCLVGQDTLTPWCSPAGAEVVVHIPCPVGCTLTHGYWKTHAQQGTAGYDSRWELILPDGEYTPFFDSGKSYFEAISSESVNVPEGYYKLAVQYIAAKLNILTGAFAPEKVADAMLFAEKYFGGEISPSLSTITKKALILDQFNNGLLGTPHCG